LIDLRQRQANASRATAQDAEQQVRLVDGTPEPIRNVTHGGEQAYAGYDVKRRD
jgi:hypothetical protein